MSHGIKSCPIDVTENLGVDFLYVVYRHGNDVELIPTVEMENRHPVEGLFGNEFPSICKHAELWRPEVAKC